MFMGLGFMLVLVPIQGIIFGNVARFRRAILTFTDERVKLMNEIIVGIRVIKFYAWERPVLDRIRAVRAEELSRVKKLAYTIAIGFSMILMGAPIVQPILIFLVYAGTGGVITAAKAFTTVAFFNLMV